MGSLNYSYKKAIFDELQYNIVNDISQYYVFASNPVPFTSNSIPSLINNDYSRDFVNNWEMIFGKLINGTNIVPVVNNNVWTSNNVYNRYDNTDTNLNNFYVVTQPSIVGADYIVYKCIDNANGALSTIAPTQIQSNTFYTADNYAWRYMYSISNVNYLSFSTNQYIPVIANAAISVGASNNAGIDVVIIANGGSGYNTYHDGVIQSVNSNIIQISSNAAFVNYFYNNNAIYIHAVNNTSPTTSQLLLVTNYISNSTGNWVYTNNAANTKFITPGQTQYKISPAIIFNTNGISDPEAYSIINPISNSIANVVMIQNGSQISWANVIVSSNTNYGSGANLYAIVSSPGGHGANPAVELGMQGFCVSFTFANSEASVIPTNITYNKIGIIKDPYTLGINETKSIVPYTNISFNQLLSANVSALFNIGDDILGSTSGALGTVAFANSTIVYMTGDKNFINNETVTSVNNPSVNSYFRINYTGSIYTKDLNPIYIQNINNVTRANNQSESFKLIIQL